MVEAMSRQVEKAKKGTLKKVLSYLRRYWFFMALSVLLAAASVAASLYIPILTGSAVDLILGPGQVDFSGIFRILVKIGIAIGVAALCQWTMNVAITMWPTVWYGIFGRTPSAGCKSCRCAIWIPTRRGR